MRTRFYTLFDTLGACRNAAFAANNGRKPKASDLRKLGLSEEYFQSRI
jgi:hypothetical protein